MNLDNNKEIYEMGSKYLMPTYSRYHVVFTRAKMQYLWDAEGNKYLDFLGGYGCLNVGHSNKYVVKELKKQIENIIQPSNVYFNRPQVRLAKRLCEITGFGEKVYFANSGTEAVEGAIKLARKYSADNYNYSRYEIITFKRAFHGRTMGALSATSQPAKQDCFKPLLGGFNYAVFNDIDSVKRLVNKKTCAIMLEPVQGESGVYPADKKFIEGLSDICKKNDILLIFDEIQTGFARTGAMFAYQNFNIFPDILAVAKSLGGGMPIGAVISTDKISKSFSPGTHGSTFGGNAASCSAGLAVIDYITANKLDKRSRELGKYFMKKLMSLKKKYKKIKEVRGMGLMIGMEFAKPVTEDLVCKALEDKLNINKVSSYTLRFLPTLVITKDNIRVLIKWLDSYIREIKDG
jgi:acetylornithine aminotransferase/acetylornithine/N-succinyldiaminopimelate aminotransferase